MINCPACSPFLKKGINGHLTALCLPPFDSGVYAHLQDVTDPVSVLCLAVLRLSPSGQGAELRPPLGEGSSLCLRAGPSGKKQHGPGFENRPKNYPPEEKKAKDRTSPLQKKRKERGSGRIDSCIRARIRVHAELLAFDPRAFSSLLTREVSIWFYARHRNFVGLSYFVFSVEFRFRVDADWSRSCTEIAGLWTHVHSFPLAAFVGFVGVVCLVLLLRFFVFLLFSAACACTIWRLIGIFWVRRRNFSRPLYLYVYSSHICLLNWRLRSLVARACRVKKNLSVWCWTSDVVCVMGLCLVMWAMQLCSFCLESLRPLEYLRRRGLHVPWPLEQKKDVGCVMLSGCCDVKCVMLSVWCWVCDVGCVMLSVCCWVCDVEGVMLSVWCWVCDVGCVMLGMWRWVCNVGCVMLGVWCLYVTLSVWCWVCDAECLMLNVWW